MGWLDFKKKEHDSGLYTSVDGYGVTKKTDSDGNSHTTIWSKESNERRTWDSDSDGNIRNDHRVDQEDNSKTNYDNSYSDDNRGFNILDGTWKKEEE